MILQPMNIGLPNFNPRFPRGKRLYKDQVEKKITKFQSTLPAREATYKAIFQCEPVRISIHASREGSD